MSVAQPPPPPPPSPGAGPAAQRRGRATLHLDASPVRLGSWLSGLVEIPARLDGSDIRLFVECTRDAYSLRSGPSYRWFRIDLLDGSRLETRDGRAYVPFAVRLPADAPPSSHDTKTRVRVDWRLRVEALRPGPRFAVALEETFDLPVASSDGAAQTGADLPPRTMSELAPDDVVRRLRAIVERNEDALVIRFPFPAGAAATALASAAVFGAAGLASVAPGIVGVSPALSGLAVGVAVVSGALSAFMLFVLLMTTRTLAVGPETLRMSRGFFGFGFHRSLATRNVAEVVENPSLLPNASPRLYGVGLRLKDGTLYGIGTRMRDCASARALAQLLGSALKRP